MKAKKTENLIVEIENIIDAIKHEEHAFEEVLEQVHPNYAKSARNFIRYNTFRAHDLTAIQKNLGYLGLTRLSNAEGHILASLIKIRQVLHKLIDVQPPPSLKSGPSMKNGKRLQSKNSKALIGYRSKGRRVRIMATMPTQAAHDYHMVHHMVKNGMNCVRINCAHDNAEIWENIVEKVRIASKKLKRKIKITMDLAGPKIRTGAIAPGPKTIKFSPERDDKGIILNPAVVVLLPKNENVRAINHVPVDAAWLNKLAVGDTILFQDARNKSRKLKVLSVSENRAIASCQKTCYLATGTLLRIERLELEDVRVGELPAVAQSILLQVNDSITITKDSIPGNPAERDDAGNIIRKANISCQLPEIFSRVKAGEPVLFDDGKIEGVITQVYPEFFDVKITKAKQKGSKLKAEKGINFPFSDLRLSGLTEKDITDLEFITQHADVVNFSFVNSKKDVNQLLDVLKKLAPKKSFGIILKIETRLAFENLKEILLTAMKFQNIGVMIARGDLAVEIGWDKIARVQSEIIALCSAAHIPVVWATQVLESLVKGGLPSRSEITDVQNSLKAECVMLNKGPYINEAIQLLNTILSDMEQFHNKNQLMLPKLQKV
ncbi:MAG: pyruvate kinase [Bacteroidota bacterium]